MRRQAAVRWRAAHQSLRTVIPALLVFWLVIPLTPLLLLAGASRWSGTSRLPQDLGLRGWQEALDAGMIAALARSGLLGAAVALIATPLGVMAGRALGWRLLRRPALPSVVLLGPVVLAPFAVAMGLDVVILRLGVPGEVAVVLVLSVFALPYTTFTMRATYLGLDPALEDQARVLGASSRQARRRVTLPAAATGLVTATGLARTGSQDSGLLLQHRVQSEIGGPHGESCVGQREHTQDKDHSQFPRNSQTQDDDIKTHRDHERCQHDRPEKHDRWKRWSAQQPPPQRPSRHHPERCRDQRDRHSQEAGPG